MRKSSKEQQYYFDTGKCPVKGCNKNHTSWVTLQNAHKSARISSSPPSRKTTVTGKKCSECGVIHRNAQTASKAHHRFVAGYGAGPGGSGKAIR